MKRYRRILAAFLSVLMLSAISVTTVFAVVTLVFKIARYFLTRARRKSEVSHGALERRVKLAFFNKVFKLVGGNFVADFKPCRSYRDFVQSANKLAVDKYIDARLVTLLLRYVGYFAHTRLL